MQQNDSTRTSDDIGSTGTLEPKSPQEIEKDRLRRFPDIPSTPDPDDNIGIGVLLSDQIRKLAVKYKMIYPFDEDNSLKAASYELRVGSKFGRAGITCELKEGEKVTIQPFDVVLIQTLETINLPRFVIARWNIRIKWAYRGLLWVGAPQVDPGFRGFLSCPLYNLSSKPVELQFGEQFAAMDFVRTTEVQPESKEYKWDNRTRMIFEDYERDKLESALVTMAARRLDEMEKLAAKHTQGLGSIGAALENTRQNLEAGLQAANQHATDTSARLTKHTEDNTKAIQSRLDSYTATTFTVIAFLFAALGVALTKSPEFSFWSSSAPLAGIALWFALKAFYFARAGGASAAVPHRMWFEIGSGAVLAVVFLVLQYRGMTHDYAEWTSSRQASIEAKEAVERLKNQVTASEDLQRRIADLQTQVDALRAGEIQRPPAIASSPKAQPTPRH